MAEDHGRLETTPDYIQRIAELLTTPEFKDRATGNLAGLQPEQARELARVLFWSDSVFSFGVVAGVPRGFNFLVAFIDEAAQQLQQIPPLMLREFSHEILRSVDGAGIGRLFENSAFLLEIMVRGLKDNPAAETRYRKRVEELLLETARSADFGRFRRSATRLADLYGPALESATTKIINDPVAFANLAGILPPLLNNLLRGTARVLAELDYPPEILAGATFNLLGDLEGGEAGKLVNGLCRLINRLHEGNALLGGNEPRLQGVLTGLAEQARLSIDGPELAGALLALGEDLETILRVAADWPEQDPEMATELLSVLLPAMGAVLRGATCCLEKLGDLPPGSYRGLNDRPGAGCSAEAADLATALFRIVNRALGENPGLAEEFFASLHGPAGREALQELLKNLLGPRPAPAPGENAAPLLPPEEAAAVTNSLLLSFNRKATAGPPGKGTYLGAFIENIDHAELEQALLITSDRLNETLVENPGLSRSLLKSILRITWGAVRGALRFRGRQKGPPGEKAPAASGERKEPPWKN